jgi:hypothetical protein
MTKKKHAYIRVTRHMRLKETKQKLRATGGTGQPTQRIDREMSAAGNYYHDDDDSRSLGKAGQLQRHKIATESADDAGVGVLLRAVDDVLRVVGLLRVPRRRVPHQRLGRLHLLVAAAVFLVAAALLLVSVVLLLLRPRADGDDLCGRPVVPAELGHDIDGVDQAGHRHLAVLHVHRERVDAWSR